MDRAKFRGITTKGQMIFGSLVITTHGISFMPSQHTKTWIIESSFGNGGWFNVCRRQYVMPNTVGQFTGLTDKNGVEIYEGDVVEIVRYDGELRCNCSVEFNGGKYIFNGAESIAPTKNAYNFKSSILEVIGNIHQNPEMLK